LRFHAEKLFAAGNKKCARLPLRVAGINWGAALSDGSGMSGLERSNAGFCELPG